MNRVVVIGAYYSSTVTTGANKRFKKIAQVLSEKCNLVVIVPRGERVEFGSERINLSSNNRGLKFLQIAWYLLKYRNTYMVIGDLNPIPNLFGLRNYYHLIHDLRIVTDYKRDSMQLDIYKFLYILSLKFQKRFIVVSDFTKLNLQRLVSHTSEIITLPNGIDGKICTDIIRNDHQLLYVATFEYRKNHELLVKTLALLPEKYKLVLVGKDLGCLSRILKLTTELDLESRVTFYTEELSEEDLDIIYRQSGIYVSPSRYEGFGMPVLEALEQDMRILVTSLEPHKQIVGDHECFDINISAQQLVGLIINASKVDSAHRLRQLELYNWKSLVVNNLLLK